MMDSKKQQRPVTSMETHVMVFGVTNLGVVLVPYSPNSEESPKSEGSSRGRSNSEEEEEEEEEGDA